MSATISCSFSHRAEQGRSLGDYKYARNYSHIANQFDFKTNNKLLIAKIINPRRDKIIMDTLVQASPKFVLRKKKFMLANLG